MRPIDADTLKRELYGECENCASSTSEALKKVNCMACFDTCIDSSPTIDPVHVAGGVYCRECVSKNCCKIEELFIEMNLKQEFRFCGCGEKYEDLPE